MSRIRVLLGVLAVAACTGSDRGADSTAVGGDSVVAADTMPADTTPVDTTVVTVTGPTVLAAFPVTEAEASRSTALGEALENFQRHLDNASDSLEAHGIDVYERYGATIHWRFGDTITTRQVPPDRPLYVLLSPTAGEQLIIGVQSDSALFVQARRHFERRP